MADNKKISPQGYLYFSVPFSTNPFWEGEGPAPSEPVVEPLNITANGTYEAPAGVDGYNPVVVNVPASEIETYELTIDSNVYTQDHIFYPEESKQISAINYIAPELKPLTVKSAEIEQTIDAVDQHVIGFDPVIVERIDPTPISKNIYQYIVLLTQSDLNELEQDPLSGISPYLELNVDGPTKLLDNFNALTDLEESFIISTINISNDGNKIRKSDKTLDLNLNYEHWAAINGSLSDLFNPANGIIIKNDLDANTTIELYIYKDFLNLKNHKAYYVRSV